MRREAAQFGLDRRVHDGGGLELHAVGVLSHEVTCRKDRGQRVKKTRHGLKILTYTFTHLSTRETEADTEVVNYHLLSR